MNKLFFLLQLFVVASCPFAYAQQNTTSPLQIGEQRTIYSNVLQEERILNIYLPPDYNAQTTYPVVYLLDGSMDEDFLHITGLIQFFNLMFEMPDCIIVGIANVDRKRDFTFHTDLEDLQRDFPTTGHSDAFIRFIATELQPFIQATYKTNDVKYLIGQSLGGLLATEILLKQPVLFTHYFIISPSLWWDNESMLQSADELLAKQKNLPPFIYIAVGKQEDKLMRKEAKSLYRKLRKLDNSNIQLTYNLMENENHATILHNSIYAALLIIFPYTE